MMREDDDAVTPASLRFASSKALTPFFTARSPLPCVSGSICFVVAKLASDGSWRTSLSAAMSTSGEAWCGSHGTIPQSTLPSFGGGNARGAGPRSFQPSLSRSIALTGAITTPAISSTTTTSTGTTPEQHYYHQRDEWMHVALSAVPVWMVITSVRQCPGFASFGLLSDRTLQAPPSRTA